MSQEQYSILYHGWLIRIYSHSCQYLFWIKGLVSEETMVRWVRKIQKFGFINRVGKVNWPLQGSSKADEGLTLETSAFEVLCVAN